MIEFQKVDKTYPPSRFRPEPIIALGDISLKIGKNEFVCLVGKSGAGKTTLFRLLMAEEKPTKGRIFFDGIEVGKIKQGNLFQLRRRIGAVFQDYKLLQEKTAGENVAYVMEVTGAADSEIKRDVLEVLDIVGLANHANNFPAELSGGEKQKVAIARALIHRPEVILADEPTGNLDPYSASEILKLLLKINELGTTVVLATHNKEIVNSLKKRVITLDNGKIVRDEEKGRFIL